MLVCENACYIFTSTWVVECASFFIVPAPVLLLDQFHRFSCTTTQVLLTGQGCDFPLGTKELNWDRKMPDCVTWVL